MPQAPDDDTKRDTYRRTRDAFNEMDMERQASFLVEATAAVIARSVEEAGRVVARGIGELFHPRSGAPSSSHDRPGPGPAEPETAQQRRPHGGRDADAR